jgi:Tfp pilus assembly protein PilO
MPKPTHKPFWMKRRYYLPLAIGLAVNGLVYLALTYRLATKQERLAREQTSLTETLEGRKADLAKLESERERLVRNDETADAFWTEVVQPRDPGLTEAIRELDRLAGSSGVEAGQIGFQYDELDVGLVQVTASMPLEGTYFNLVRFINSLERSQRFFLVRKIGLRKSSQEDAIIALTCDVSFFYRTSEDGAGQQS